MYVHVTLYFLPQTFPDPPLALIYHLHKSHQWIRACILINHVHMWAGNKSVHTWSQAVFLIGQGNFHGMNACKIAAAWSKYYALILPRFWLQYYHGNNIFWRYKYRGVTLIYVLCLSTNDLLRIRQIFAEKISINLRSLSEDWTADLAFYM